MEKILFSKFNFQSKEEADNVMHTHDDQKVYKFDKVHTTDNRASYALSGISDMSKLTAGAGNNDGKISCK